MTTIIEQMAKAIGSADLSKPGWNEQAARAALAVLAECKLPHRLQCSNGDATTVIYMNAASRSLFSCILRALIEEPQRGDTVGSEHASASLTQNKTETAE